MYNLYIADMDKCMRNRGIGSIKSGIERVWSLAYVEMGKRFRYLESENVGKIENDKGIRAFQIIKQ